MTEQKSPLLLLVEDEEDIQELLTYNLHKAGYRTLSALTGDEGLKLALSASPDLLLLDLMLPAVSGVDICKRVRADDKANTLPIIMLTALGSESEVVEGLEAGADDYVTKPFSLKVLLARITTQLRRAAQRGAGETDHTYSLDRLSVDRKKHRATIDGEDLGLTFSEYAILDALINRQGGVMTRQQIVASIRGGDIAVTLRSIDVHVTALRKKLGVYGEKVVTVRGVGYRFDE